jgi:hypothetical protein
VFFVDQGDELRDKLGMGSELAILAVDKSKLSRSETSGTEALSRLQQAPCETDEQEALFADFMKRAHHIVADLEAERETAVRPLIDDKAKIDSLYKAARLPWEGIKMLCKGKIADRQQVKKRLEDELRAEAVQAALQGDCIAPLVEQAPPPASVSWEWVVKSFRKGEMPLEYLVPDLDALRLVCRRHKHSEKPPVIQGVVFERSAKVRV